MQESELIEIIPSFFLVVHCAPCWILVPQPEIETVVPCIGITKSYPLDHQGSPKLFVWYAPYLEPVSFFPLCLESPQNTPLRVDVEAAGLVAGNPFSSILNSP